MLGIKKISVLCFWGLLGISCSADVDQKDLGPLTKLSVSVVDSLIVDELATLVMDDYNPATGYFMLRGTRSRKPYLVDTKGTIINVFNVLDDGPNGVGVNGAFGYRFLDKERWVAQGLYNGYHMYTMSGKKLKTVPHNHLGLFSMSVFTYQTTFHPFVRDGEALMIGREPNLFDPKQRNPEVEGGAYYEKADVIYRYNLDTEESQTLQSYPPEWTPRVQGTYVGPTLPIIAFHEKKQELALLPSIGNQLFIYDCSSSSPKLKYAVILTHKNRPAQLPQLAFTEEDNFSDYPAFFDIRYVGDKILIVFNTRIPKDVMRQLRALSEEYYNLPEYKEAVAKYVMPQYIVVQGDQQIGIIDRLPVPGVVDFGDSEGFFYVNDNINPEIERDYNVFYKLTIEQ